MEQMKIFASELMFEWSGSQRLEEGSLNDNDDDKEEHVEVERYLLKMI